MAFCADYTVQCNTCWETEVTDCDFSFSIGLADGSQHYVTIVDKFNKMHTDLYEIGDGGVLTLDTTNYTDAFFTEYGGFYEMFLHEVETVYTPLNLSIEGESYKCILFTVDGVCCAVEPTPVEVCGDLEFCFSNENNSQYLILL